MPQPLPSPRRYPQLFAAICSTPWAMTESQVHILTEVMNLRGAGMQFTPDEITARIQQHQQHRLGQPGALLGEDTISREKPQIIDGVAVLPVQGMLAPRMDMFMQYSGGTSTQELMAWIEDAATNQKVTSILLDIDSPGGDAHGNQEVANLLRQVREDMPVKAVISNLGASAAYYIGSAAGELIASPSAEVGSIGVYYVHREDTKANEEDGHTYNVFRAGADKNVANQHEVLTSHGRQVTQERMDALYQQFVQSVADGRKTTAEVVLRDFGGGRVMLADQALAAGMVDRVATLQEVFQEMRRPGTTATGQRSTFNAVTVPTKETTMDPLIKNAAISAGLCDAKATDEVAQAAVNGFFHARAESVPTDATEATLALLQPGNRLSAAAVEPAAPVEPIDAAAVAADAVSADASRRAEITATGNIMGIDQADIAAACDDLTCSHDAATRQFRAISARNNAPIGTGGGVSVTGASEDRMAAAAIAGLSARFECSEPDDANVVGAREFVSMSGVDLVRIASGTDFRQTVGMDPLQMAADALRGPDLQCHAIGGGISAAAGPQNPASLPNIMSAVLGRTLDRGLQNAPTTFDFFARRIDSVADLNPKEIIRTGLFGEFNLLPDAGTPEEDKFVEEANWYKADRYAKRVSLTPEMLINEHMGVFIDDARKLALAHDKTLNRLCVDQLLAGLAGDGVALFDASSHGNIIAAGANRAAPSVTTIDAGEQLAAAQTDPGNQAEIGLQTVRILVPRGLNLVTQQVIRNDLNMVPTTDATVNPYRGEYEMRVEPLLHSNSPTAWYQFVDPSIAAAIVYCYLRGYENMKRRFHFDPNTQVRHLDVEGAFASAVNNWRGAVKNPGA